MSRITLDLYKCANYSAQIQQLNKRIKELDKAIYDLYDEIGWGNHYYLRQVDSTVSYSNKLNNCARYLTDTYNDFQKISDELYLSDISELSKYTQQTSVVDIAVGIGGAVGAISKGVVTIYSGISDIAGLLDLISEDGSPCKDWIEKIEGMKGLSLFSEAFGWYEEGKNMFDAIQSGNATEIYEAGKSFTTKALETGFTALGDMKDMKAKLYATYAMNMAESVIEEGGEFTKDMTLANGAEFVWGMTGGAVLETGAEVAWDIVDSIPGLNLITNGYEERTGKEGVEAFYEEGEQLLEAVMGKEWCDYYEEQGGYVKGVVNGTIEVAKYVGETIGDTATTLWDKASKGVAGFTSVLCGLF